MRRIADVLSGAAWIFRTLWLMYHVLVLLSGGTLNFAPLMLLAVPYYVLLVKKPKGSIARHYQRLALTAAMLGCIDLYITEVYPLYPHAYPFSGIDSFVVEHSQK